MAKINPADYSTPGEYLKAKRAAAGVTPKSFETIPDMLSKANPTFPSKPKTQAPVSFDDDAYIRALSMGGGYVGLTPNQQREVEEMARNAPTLRDYLGAPIASPNAGGKYSKYDALLREMENTKGALSKEQSDRVTAAQNELMRDVYGITFGQEVALPASDISDYETKQGYLRALDMIPKSGAGNRTRAAAESIAANMAGSMMLAGEAAVQGTKNAGAIWAMQREIEDANRRGDAAAIPLIYEKYRDKIDTPVSIEGDGGKLIGYSRDRQGKATYGLSDTEKFLMETGISTANYLGTLAMTGGNPAFALGLMGIQAGANQMYDAGEKGVDSYLRQVGSGIASGAIEALVERIPLGNLLKFAKSGGGSLADYAMGVLKQAGLEGSEEAVNYAAGVLANKLILGGYADDFDVKEMLRAAAMGATSGGAIGAVMGAPASIYNARAEAAYSNTGRAWLQTNGNIDEKIAEGIASKNADANALARELLVQTRNGVQPSEADIGKLVLLLDGRFTSEDARRLEGVTPETEAASIEETQTEVPSETQTETMPLQEAQISPVSEEIESRVNVPSQGEMAETTEPAVTETVQNEEQIPEAAAEENAPAKQVQAEQESEQIPEEITRTRNEILDYAKGKAKKGLTKNAASESLGSKDRKALARVANIFGVEVTLVDSLPFNESVTNGLYQNGHIFIAKDREDALYTVLAHEITHHLERTAADTYTKYQDAAVSALGYDEETIASEAARDGLTAEEYRKEIAAYFTAQFIADPNNEAESRRRIMSIVNADRNVALKVYNAIRDVINKLRRELDASYMKGMQSTLDYTEKLWRECLKEGAKNREKTVVKNATVGEKAQYSKKRYDFTKSFSEQVDDYKSGNFSVRNSFLVGPTPAILKKIGFNSLPVTINQSHVRDALFLNKEKPDRYITESVLKQLPNALEKPIAVITSKSRPNTSVVALLEFVKYDGEQIIVPVVVEGFGKTNGVEIDSHAIASAHKRKNAITYLLKEALSNEKSGKIGVFYIEKNKASKLLQSVGLQLPETLNDSDGFVHSIREKNSPVKPKFEDVTYSQQFKRWFGDWQNNPQKASKVVNDDGTPKVMYRGDPEEIRIFDRKKAKNGQLGRGFYFTDSPSHAGHYGSAREYYLNIRNPISADEKTISNKQLVRFLEEIESREDDYDLYNYGEDYSIPAIARSLSKKKSDFEILNDINLTAIGNLVECVELFNEVNGTKFDGIITDIETVVFDSRQIKSATDNIGTFDAENPDVNFSNTFTAKRIQDRMSLAQQNTQLKTAAENLTKEVKAQQRKINSLTAQVEKEKAERKLTDGIRLKQSDIKAVAKSLVTEFSSEYDAKELEDNLTSLYNAMSNVVLRGGDPTQNATKVAKKLAKRVIDKSLADVFDAEDYAGVRGDIRASKLNVPAEVRADEKYKEGVRERMKGVLRTSKDGEAVEVAYSALSEKYPSYFPDDILTPIDQITRILDVYEAMTPTQVNPYEQDLDFAYETLAMQIVGEYFTVKRAPTFADKQAAKFEELRAKKEAEINRLQDELKAATIDNKWAGKDKQELEKRIKSLEKEIEREEAKVTAAKVQARWDIAGLKDEIAKVKAKKETEKTFLKAQFKAKTKESRERQEAKEVRNKIIRHVKTLSDKLLTPTNTKHVPEEFRLAVAQLLEYINLESTYGYDAETGKLKKGGEGATKQTNVFRELKKAYAEILSDAGNSIVLDEELRDVIDSLSELENIRLNEMTLEQLNDVWDVVRSVEHAITTADKNLSEMKEQSARMTAKNLISGIKQLPRYVEKNPDNPLGFAKKGFSDLLLMDMITPNEYLHMFGSSGDGVFTALRRAQDKYTSIVAETKKGAEKWLTPQTIKKYEFDTHKFALESGKEVTLSIPQIMSLYCLSRREQAKSHLFGGGILVSPIKQKGKATLLTQKESLQLTENDLDRILSVLNKEEYAEVKKTADKIQQYMSSTLSQYGNEASMAVYGYEKFKEKVYFPIKTPRNAVRPKETDLLGDILRKTTIAGKGFAKQTKAGAASSVVVDDIFSMFADHVDEMATYSAYLAVIEDVKRLVRINLYNDAGELVKLIDVIDDKMGTRGVKYLDKLIDDVNTGNAARGDRAPTETLLSQYKRAMIAANLRVVVQQPTSLIRVLAEIDPKYVGQAILRLKRGDWKRLQEFAPIAQWKAWGYYDIHAGRQIRDLIFDTEKTLDRVLEWGAVPMQTMDAFVWNVIYHAAAAETEAKGIIKGSAAYDAAVRDRFNYLINKTQVVDGILQRSQIARSDSAINRMSVSFMSEPLKTYNMFISAVRDVRSADDASKAAAKKKVARTVAMLITANVVNALMQSIVDAIRDDDRDKKYGGRLLKALIGTEGDEETSGEKFKAMLSGNIAKALDPIGYIPYVKDVESLIRGYSMDRMDMESISLIVSSVQKLVKAFEEDNKTTINSALADVIINGAALFGVPASSLRRDVLGVMKTFAIENDAHVFLYNLDKMFYKVENDKNLGVFIDTYWRATKNDPDAADYIYNDLIDSVPEEMREERKKKIRSKLDDKLKEEQGVESVKDLTERAMLPEEKAHYDKIVGASEKSAAWKRATGDERSAHRNAVYKYIVSGEKAEDVQAAKRAGISENKYFEFLLAAEAYDEFTEEQKEKLAKGEKVSKALDQKEGKEAIDSIGGLSNAERAWLWRHLGWKDKNNPYK